MPIGPIQPFVMSHHRIIDMASRFGLIGSRGYRVLQYFVLMAGLVAMAAITVPDVRAELRAWLIVGLWCCLGFFTVELAVRLWTKSASEHDPSYLLSAAGAIDALAVLPIPIALFVGVPNETAWLLASLWLLKVTPSSPDCPCSGASFHWNRERWRACSSSF